MRGSLPSTWSGLHPSVAGISFITYSVDVLGRLSEVQWWEVSQRTPHCPSRTPAYPLKGYTVLDEVCGLLSGQSSNVCLISSAAMGPFSGLRDVPLCCPVLGQDKL